MSIFSTEPDMRDERAFAHLVNHRLQKTAPTESSARKKQLQEALSGDSTTHRHTPMGGKQRGRQTAELQ
jgi:hypothetical protein